MGSLGWNSDDERDFEDSDQQYSPPSPMAYYPGSHNPELNPLARFMADLPDFNDMDMRALDDDLQRFIVIYTIVLKRWHGSWLGSFA
jgi:hypothetical protein